jgi:UDP-4-amino-4,6-dideoxy-N-acetyl-beta-L-altrosamine N-acetyltransferase
VFTRNNCCLRPMAASDLETVLSWRNSDRIRNMMYTDHIISPEEHQAWFARVSHSANSRHLIFEYNGRPAGVVNVTDIDARNRRCDWGFYLGETDLPKGCGTVMGALALEFIFEQMGMNKVVGEVLAHNEQSMNYHVRLGFVKEGRLNCHELRHGNFEDVIVFAHFSERWRQVKSELTAVFTQETSV